MGLDWTFAVVLATTSLGTALTALALLPLMPRLGRRRVRASASDMVFLFDDEHLIDATPEARRFLSGGPSGLSDWQRLCALIVPRFPGFPERMAQLARDGSAVLTEAGGDAQLGATWLDGIARLTLTLPETARDGTLPDGQSLAALKAELATLRDVVEAMPTPAWQVGADGRVSWANSAYLALIRNGLDEDEPLTWPLPALFAPAPGNGTGPHRQALRLSAEEDRWFDVMTVEGRGEAVQFALPADGTVRAETALRNFLQTLTKTFAELRIGLAVFNRARELALFNPAMSELFNLEPEFLSARPTLPALLDRLRETRMMPEPKDYRSWREAILRLEQDAADGVYAETWTLPSGQVYRVTGRPHPDGAVAFLFEDISAEMSLTRRFRSEIETAQSVIDSLDEAIAVFSNAGVLTLSNTAYTALWGDDPLLVMGTADIAEATAQWMAQCRAAPGEGAPDLARRIRQRQPWAGELVHHDGRRLACRMAPIAGGGMLVRFAAPAPGTAQRPAAPAMARAGGRATL